jgi:pilus assembly protein CpaB
MNRRRYLIIAALALVIGFLVSVIAYRKVQGMVGLRESRIEVMVAAHDLQVGAKVEEHDIRIIKIAATDLPPGAPRRRADVEGHGVVLPIFKGEFILPNRLAGENAGAGLPSLIPPGMRAVSVRVNDVVSVDGFVTPGARVDVLLTVTMPEGERQTATVLQNVKVLASGHSLERNTIGEPLNTSVITLVVPLADAQRLTLASSEGHILLVLRNPLDITKDAVAPANLKDLYNGVAPAAKPVVHYTVIRKITPPVLPESTPLRIKVYQGDKKPDEVKCADQTCE